ncbi:MAG TPA: NfeD family protein [Verrucomicrobiae bacterium]|nr:NfeD family protein [Verrucomicrobiae bacterium]
MVMAVVWLILAIGFAVGETMTLAFYAIFIAAGAAVAAVIAGLGLPILAQALGFAAVAIGGVGLVRRPVMRTMRLRQGGGLISGAAGLVGEEAVVVTTVGDPLAPGQVHARGEDWPAITEDGQPIATGQTVLILELRQTRLVVTVV